ncbi:MAG: ATP-binding cassette domain-containing protein [Spirochaetota bacterium]
MGRSMMNVFFVVAGVVFTGIGMVGVVLPVLPTTPFLLVASVCFLRSSTRLHRWLMTRPGVSRALRRMRDGKGIPRRTKIVSMTLATLMLGAFALFGTTSPHVRIALAAVLTLKAVAMVAMPTYAKPAREVERFRIRAPRGRLALAVAGAVGASLTSLAVYLALAALVVGREPPLATINDPGSLFGVIGVALAVRYLLLGISRSAGARLSASVLSDAREALYRSIVTAGPDTVRDRGVGELRSLMVDRVDALDPFYSLYIPQLIAGLITPLAVLAIMIGIDATTGLTLLALIPIVPLLLGLTQRRFRAVGVEYGAAQKELGRLYLDSIRALESLSIFGRVKAYGAILRSTSASLRSRTIRLLVVNQLVLLLVELFFSLTILAATVALAIARFGAGALDPASALALPLISIELVRPLNLVGAFFFAGVVGRDARREIEAFVNDHPSGSDHKPKGFAASGASGASGAAAAESAVLRLENVTFAYPVSPESPVVEEFSMQIEQGQVVGLAGPSGSGKSTVARIVLGLLQPQAGRVIIAGRDAKQLDHRELARYVGYLPQHPYLFSGTLRENVALARPTATDAEVEDAVRQSGLDGFVSSLPEGLAHRVSENGATLSGGERMRVALARAVLAGTPFLVLDEPMAELDSMWESSIWRELRMIRPRVGILVIAHRASTLRACDRVVRLAANELEVEAARAGE